MIFIFLGVLLLIISSFAIFGGLSYSFSSIEKNQLKIDSLKIQNIEKLNDNEAKFSSISAISHIKNFSPKNITSQIQDHMLKKEDSERFVKNILDKLGSFVSKFVANTTKTSKELLGYLLSLTKPLDESKKIDNSVKIENIEILNIRNKPNDSLNISTISKVEDFKNNEENVSQINNSSKNKLSNNKPTEVQQATLSLVKNIEEGKNDDFGIFEKLENKVLLKLQNSGMSDYDIWLELGDLYVKYNETKKAMEIYALVLKHSVDEIQKEKAMNKLIGL
jgi:hypothetical protein